MGEVVSISPPEWIVYMYLPFQTEYMAFIYRRIMQIVFSSLVILPHYGYLVTDVLQLLVI